MSDLRRLWGEIPIPTSTQESLKETQPLPKRENLLVDVPLKCTPLPGPQPKMENDDWVKLDENVLTSIQCMDAARQMGREFEFNELLIQLQREDEKIMPWIKKRKIEDTDNKTRPCKEIDAECSRKVLKRAVTALVAHSGSHYARNSVLETITDATKHFIFTIGLQLSHRKANQSAESALMETGIGTIDDLKKYYEERIVAARYNMEAALQKLQDNPLPMPMPFSQEEETAVEIHFPAGSEEMQSSLETGLQMLLSMEEGLDSSGLN